MSKNSSHFICNNCGYESLKWAGCCSSCGEWNTFEESVLNIQLTHSTKKSEVNILKFANIPEIKYLQSGSKEFDRVLGNGAVEGEVIVLGGAPGVGKSTLLISIGEGFLKSNLRVLYFSAEESLSQVFQRAQRVSNDFPIVEKNFDFVNSNDTDDVVNLIYSEKYDVVIVDSIQAISTKDAPGIAGNINQVRESALRITRTAKAKNVFVILVSHVTKDGGLAGPMVLSHIVDGVFMLESETRGNFRILRALKNRYGGIDEIGVFQMTCKGIIGVGDISQILVKNSKHNMPGIARGILIEGIRPMIVEIEALVVKSGYSVSKRGATGIRLNRLQMLVAVLSKVLKQNLHEYDLFVNIAGGFKTSDPALDLPICMAILSSSNNFVLPKKSIFIGEVGLTGEIRKSYRHDARMREARSLGFNEIHGYSESETAINTLLGLVELLSLNKG